MIQVIEKQNSIFRLLIDGVQYHYKPVALWKDGLIPLKAKVKGSTIGWNVQKRFISVSQIHRAIKNK